MPQLVLRAIENKETDRVISKYRCRKHDLRSIVGMIAHDNEVDKKRLIDALLENGKNG